MLIKVYALSVSAILMGLSRDSRALRLARSRCHHIVEPDIELAQSEATAEVDLSAEALTEAEVGVDAEAEAEVE